MGKLLLQHVADVKKTVAPVKSSPPKNGDKASKSSSPKQQVSHVHESDTYFTIKTTKGKSKESSPVTSVQISSVHDFYIEQRKTEEIVSGFRFLPDIEISAVVLK